MMDVSRSTFFACKAIQTSNVDLDAAHACMKRHMLDPTATLMAPSDNRRPKEEMYVTFSQSPA